MQASSAEFLQHDSPSNGTQHLTIFVRPFVPGPEFASMHNQKWHAFVLQHVPFEDLGSLDAPLRVRGFDVEIADVCTAPFPLSGVLSTELLVVLGGPIGVYDSANYPFLTQEIALIRRRLQERRPTLGICLGAQLMAAALGARVYPGSAGAEIGWFPLQTPSPQPTPEWFSPLLKPGLSVFHWHGDTFDLPAGARLLAGTSLYPHQAFSMGDFALGLQFHPEVLAAGLERVMAGLGTWFVFLMAVAAFLLCEGPSRTYSVKRRLFTPERRRRGKKEQQIMSKTVNKVLLLGNVGKDPEIASTNGGTLVAKLSLATSEGFKDKQGEWQERTEWHKLVAYVRGAESVFQRCLD